MEALIYETITNVMQKINAISKGRQNAQQHFQYRGIDDVMNELHPVMAECGLFVVPEVLHEERTSGQSKAGSAMFYTRLTIKFTFYAKDGSNVSATVIGEAMDSGDKASNKALSIGLKYALLQVFCIPTEDDKDPDAEYHEMAPAREAPRAEPKPAAPNRQPPQLAGGPDTKEQHDEIVKLLGTRNEKGENIFTSKDAADVMEKRKTKTAVEVIEWLRVEISKCQCSTLQIPDVIF